MKLLAFNTSSNPNFAYPSREFSPKVIFSDKNNGVNIRTMSLPELVAVRDNWIVAEGWPGIKNTLAATYASDPEGFYLLEKDDNKIASISVVTYPDISFAYIGFYVVIKPFRTQGYGRLIIEETIKYSTQHRNINSFGLSCIASAQSMYNKHGFETRNYVSFWRFTKKSSSTIAESKQEVSILNQISEDFLNEIIAYDTHILGANRHEFLMNFLFKPGTKTVISLVNNRITGYGVISERDPAIAEPHTSYKLAPLYADDEQIATQILQQLMSVVNVTESVYLEIPDNNQAARTLVETFGFEEIGEQANMIKGMPPKFVETKIFCYNSIAIGG